MNSATSKVCVRCGRDCSDRPRVRDEQGRYCCRECLDRGPAAANKAVAAASEAVVDAGYDIDVDVAAEPAASKPSAFCPDCGRALTPETKVCVQCGFSREKGIGGAGNAAAVVGAAKPAGRVCKKCGYDLAGLKSPKCPECGTVNFARSRRERDEAEHARVSKWAYRKPLIMIGVGIPITFLIYFVLAYNASGSMLGGFVGGGVYIARYALAVPFGLLVYWICSVLWIGFDEPFHLTALRLAAVYAVTDTVATITSPLWWIGWFITGTTYVGLMMDIMELDMQDAVIVGLITFIARVITILFVVVPILMWLFPGAF